MFRFFGAALLLWREITFRVRCLKMLLLTVEEISLWSMYTNLSKIPFFMAGVVTSAIFFYV
jgi:hypothetical protein